ncbi:unnamed protein product, partial [Durusdinium trenchii]
EDIQQEAPEEEIPQETPEDIQEEIGFDHPPERLAVVGAPIAGDVSVDKSVKKDVRSWDMPVLLKSRAHAFDII